MADTTAPAPNALTILQGFVPSLGQSLIIIVTALASIAGTIVTQRMATPRMEIVAADKPAPVSLQKQINDVVNRLDGRISEVGGVCGLAVDEIQMLKKDHRSPRAASPTAKSAATK